MLDLFSGLEGASKEFREREGWKVITIDDGSNIDSEKHSNFNPTFEKNILEVKPKDIKEDVNFVWASPPCTTFTIARCWDYWDNTGEDDKMVIPQENETVNGIRLVYHALYLIQKLDPEFWILENPRGYMRKILPRDPEGTITYCEYGHHLMKPTDLWGEIPNSFEFRMCSPGDDCHSNEERGMGSGSDHVRDPAERSKIPEGVSKEVFRAVNKELP